MLSLTKYRRFVNSWDVRNVKLAFLRKPQVSRLFLHLKSILIFYDVWIQSKSDARPIASVYLLEVRYPLISYCYFNYIVGGNC